MKVHRRISAFMSALIFSAVNLVPLYSFSESTGCENKSEFVSIQAETKGMSEDISINIEGVLPEDTVASAETAEIGDYEQWDSRNILCAYNISLFSCNSEIEPESSVKVRIEGESVEDSRTFQVWHIPDGENAVPEFAGNVTAENNSLSFYADSFSVYVIVDDSGELVTPRHTYHFLDYGERIENSDEYTAEVYNFPARYTENGETEYTKVNTQILKDGEVLQNVPDPPDVIVDDTIYHFYGWYEVEKTGERDGKIVYRWPENPVRTEMDSIIEVESDRDIYLVPLYTDYRFAVFYDTPYNISDSTENGRIIKKKLAVLGTNFENDTNGTITSVKLEKEILISDIEAPQFDSTKFFYGWNVVFPDGTSEEKYIISSERGADFGTKKETSITIDDSMKGDIRLYPIFEEAHWIGFSKENSSVSYVPEVFLKPYEYTEKLNIPTYEGYSFQGWYADSEFRHRISDKDGNIVANEVTDDYKASNGTLELKSNITLYPKWTETGNSEYRIIFWKQNIFDEVDKSDSEKDYDYFTSRVVDGQIAGSTAEPDESLYRLSAMNSLDKPFYSEGLEGFHFRRIDSGKIIKGDGSTTVNVYYDRDIFEFEFYSDSSCHIPYTNLKYTDGRSYNGSVFKGLYGQPFTVYGYQFPTETLWYSVFGEVSFTFADMFETISKDYKEERDSSGEILRRYVKLYKKSASSSSKIHFLTETINGEYTEEMAVSVAGEKFTITNKFSGFHYFQYSKNGRNWTDITESNKTVSMGTSDLYIRYRRNRNNVIYIDSRNGAELAREENIPYETEILNNDTFNKDFSYMNDYKEQFSGLYEDRENSIPFRFSVEGEHRRMRPDTDTIIYVGFNVRKYPVTVDPDGAELNGTTQSTFFDVAYNEKVGEYKGIEKNYTEIGEGESVPDSEAYYYRVVKNDENYVIGTPRSAGYIKVTEAEENDPYTDYTKKYRKRTQADPYYCFIGWYVVDENGLTDKSQPFNFDSSVTRPVTIRAVWGERSNIKVVYDAGQYGLIGSNRTFTEPAQENVYYNDMARTLIRESPMILSEYANSYIFEGWQDTAGNIYNAGDVYTVIKENAVENTITFNAVYKHIDESSRVQKLVKFTLDPNGGEGEPIVLEREQSNQAFDLSVYRTEFSRNGYVLAGWSTDRECRPENVMFGVNETNALRKNIAGIDKNGENVLYAVWKKYNMLTFTNNAEFTVKYRFSVSGFEGTVYKLSESEEYPDESSQVFGFTSDNGEVKVVTVEIPKNQKLRLCFDGDMSGKRFEIISSYLSSFASNSVYTSPTGAGYCLYISGILEDGLLKKHETEKYRKSRWSPYTYYINFEQSYTYTDNMEVIFSSDIIIPAPTGTDDNKTAYTAVAVSLVSLIGLAVILNRRKKEYDSIL